MMQPRAGLSIVWSSARGLRSRLVRLDFELLPSAIDRVAGATLFRVARNRFWCSRGEERRASPLRTAKICRETGERREKRREERERRRVEAAARRTIAVGRRGTNPLGGIGNSAGMHCHIRPTARPTESVVLESGRRARSYERENRGGAAPRCRRRG